MWQLLSKPVTVDQILLAILQEYEVEPNQCEQDVIELLQNLVEAKLVEIKE